MSVVDGKITKLSPTMIVSYDASTAFGCPRRWWFKYVEKRPEPQTTNQALGTALHAANEEFLLSGTVPTEPSVQDLWALGRGTLDRLRPVARKVEGEVSLLVSGIPLRGYCDLVTEEPGIWDWKTTSSIESYGKTPGQLAKDTQLILYALAEHPTATKVTLAHGQYQTKGRPAFRETVVELSKSRLDAHCETVINPLVESMVLTAKETEARAATANRNACRMCPHRGYCPSDSENPIMSFFSKYKTSPVLPPDAPVSVPAPAAVQAPPPAPEVTVPVPAPSPAAPPPPPSPAPAGAAMTVEQARAIVEKFAGKRGRRPAEFYAAQELLGQFPAAPAPSPVPAPKAPKAPVPSPLPPPVHAPLEAPVTFDAVTVNYGVTINMGNFNSVRLDVSMSAKVLDGDAHGVYERVLAEVKAKVEAEVAKLPQPSGK